MQILDINNPEDRFQIFKTLFEKYQALSINNEQAAQLAELVILQHRGVKLMPNEQKKLRQLLQLKNQLILLNKKHPV